MCCIHNLFVFKVLFPLLTKLLENINIQDPTGMEETRMRASALLTKVRISIRQSCTLRGWLFRYTTQNAFFFFKYFQIVLVYEKHNQWKIFKMQYSFCVFTYFYIFIQHLTPLMSLSTFTFFVFICFLTAPNTFPVIEYIYILCFYRFSYST